MKEKRTAFATAAESEKKNGEGHEAEDRRKKTFKEIAVQFLKFTAFSLGAGIIQLVSFTILNEFAKIEYWISYVIALILSVLYNFTINRKFTFKSAVNVPRAMFLAFLFYVPFAPYSSWLEDFLVNGRGWNEYLAVILNMVQNLFLEFLWCRFVVYRNNINTAIKNKNMSEDTEKEQASIYRKLPARTYRRTYGKMYKTVGRIYARENKRYGYKSNNHIGGK